MSLALVRAGARVAMMDVNEAWLEQTASDVREAGGDESVITVVGDVSSSDDAETAVRRAVTELGGLHILVNNAGISTRGLVQSPESRAKFWETMPEEWAKVMAVNVNGPFYMARAVVGYMLAQSWGRIIGVTTSLDTMYRVGASPYGPSKAGHEALIATMAQELEGTGVTANVLVPGGVANTNLLPADTEYDRNSIIQPEVMRAPVVWLSSEASDGINGRRFVAYNWDEALPLEQRLEKASAPAAWPQLGKQSVPPSQ
jgi:NAD(P)-dependent dehydrogenase (short-subunit alcohol dehydrogenase family)